MTDYTQTLSFAPDVVVQNIQGEALILKLQDEEVFALNTTGARSRSSLPTVSGSMRSSIFSQPSTA